MPFTSLRGSWEVRAGIAPGSPLQEHTKQFHYTSEEYQGDLAKSSIVSAAQQGKIPETKSDTEWKSRFEVLREEAFDYARELMHPRYLNWVEVVWIWY